MGEAKRRGTLEQRRMEPKMAVAEREEVARLKELARTGRSKSRLMPSLLAAALVIGGMR